MKSTLPYSLYLILVFFLLLFPSCNKDKNHTWLFNNQDLTGWDTYLGRPYPSQIVPGLERDGSGNYTEAFGLNQDPLDIFTVVDEDGEPVIRRSRDLLPQYLVRADPGVSPGFQYRLRSRSIVSVFSGTSFLLYPGF